MKKIFFALSVLCGFGLSTGASAQNVYGTLENWHNYTAGGTALEAPQNWYCFDSLINSLGPLLGTTAQKQLFKSTTPHTGTYAARIVTAFYGGAVDTLPGSLLNARPSFNLATGDVDFTNYTPVSTRIPSMSAWIKYAPANPADAGDITIQLLKSGIAAGGTDSVIGEGYMAVHTLANYTQVTVPVTYVNTTMVPDKAFIIFSSSGDSTVLAIGSAMTIDDVVLNTSTGVAIPVFGQPAVYCFPNPSNGLINFETASTAPLTWQAFSADGRLAGSYTFTGKGSFTFGDQPSGNYFFRITATDGTVVQNGTFLLKR